MTLQKLKQSGCYEGEDIFEIMRLGLRAKMEIMRSYPDMGLFAIKAYYEKDPAVVREIQESLAQRGAFGVHAPRLRLDPDRFVPGLDLKRMYQDMYWASEGFIWELGALAGVHGLRRTAEGMSFLYSGEMRALIGALAGQPVDDLTIAEPDLEEVFLHDYAKGGDAHDGHEA